MNVLHELHFVGNNTNKFNQVTCIYPLPQLPSCLGDFQHLVLFAKSDTDHDSGLEGL